MSQSLYNQDRISSPAVLTVAVGLRDSEVEKLSSAMQDVNTSRLIASESLEVLMRSRPAGQVSLVILGADSPESLDRKLRWATRYWADALIMVLSERSGGSTERMARQNGAFFFQRPANQSDFDAVIEGMLRCQAVRIKSA